MLVVVHGLSPFPAIFSHTTPSLIFPVRAATFQPRHCRRRQQQEEQRNSNGNCNSSSSRNRPPRLAATPPKFIRAAKCGANLRLAKVNSRFGRDYSWVLFSANSPRGPRATRASTQRACRCCCFVRVFYKMFSLSLSLSLSRSHSMYLTS